MSRRRSPSSPRSTMQSAGTTPSPFLLPVLLLALWAWIPLCHAGARHSITAILAGNPDFTEFSAALTSANLTAEIDRRTAITVLAVGRDAMARLKGRGLPTDNLRHVLSLHILLDYFDDAKLRDLPGGFALSTSLYQASGQASGSSGIVNITAPAGGRVGFAPYGTADAPSSAVFYEKPVKESPYDIAVLQVSDVISSPAADGQEFTPPPQAAASPGFIDLMTKNGCRGFAGLVTSTAKAADTMYQKSIDGGLTIFCPDDKAVAAFFVRFKNLNANSRASLLLYHGVAAHYSEEALMAINGEVNTLAADGANKSYKLSISDDGYTVKLSSSRSEARPARVTKTIVDKDPLAVYVIDAVLLPGELQNGSAAAPSPAPVSAPAPAPGGHASPPKSNPAPPPKPAAHTPVPTPKPVDDTPAPAPAADEQRPADEKGQHKNGADATAPWWSLGAAVAMPVVALVVLW